MAFSERMRSRQQSKEIRRLGGHSAVIMTLIGIFTLAALGSIVWAKDGAAAKPGWSTVGDEQTKKILNTQYEALTRLLRSPEVAKRMGEIEKASGTEKTLIAKALVDWVATDAARRAAGLEKGAPPIYIRIKASSPKSVLAETQRPTSRDPGPGRTSSNLCSIVWVCRNGYCIALEYGPGCYLEVVAD